MAYVWPCHTKRLGLLHVRSTLAVNASSHRALGQPSATAIVYVAALRQRKPGQSYPSPGRDGGLSAAWFDLQLRRSGHSLGATR